MKKLRFRENYIDYILGAILLVVSLFGIFIDWLPRYPDPFGYLADSYYLSGKEYTWSDVSHNMTSYYAWGYSVLLSFFFRIFGDFWQIAKAAYVLNVLLLQVFYYTLLAISKRLLSTENYFLRAFICFGICLYPSYIYNVNVIVPETLVIVLMALSVLLFIKLEETEKVIYSFLLGCVLLYMVAVHGRGVSICAIGVLVVLLMFLFKKISCSQFMAFLISCFIGFKAYMLTNTAVKRAVYMPRKGLNNDYNSVLGRFGEVFSIENTRFFFGTLLSQLFYLCSGTFLVYLAGVVKGISYFVKQVLLLRKIKLFDKKYDFVKLYIILSALAVLALSAYLFCQPKRIDQMFYGRHNEMILPFVVLLGFEVVITLDKKYKAIIFCSLGYVFCGITAYISLTGCGITQSIPRTITAFSLFYDSIIDNSITIFVILLLCLVVIAVLCVVNKFWQATSVYVFLVILIIFNGVTAYNAISTEFVANTEERADFWKVEVLLDYKELTLVAVIPENYNRSRTYLLQLIAMEQKVSYMQEEEILELITNSGGNGLIYSDTELLMDETNVDLRLLDGPDYIYIFGDEYINYLLANNVPLECVRK